MKQKNQASSMIHPKVRIKKRKRKKDLDKLKDKILNKSKTDNKIEELAADNGKQRKPSVTCKRLLPEPCIGLYRNGAKSKLLKKSRSLTVVKKNDARIQGDIIKLLDGYNSSARSTSEDNSDDDKPTEVAELLINGKLAEQNAQQKPVKRMSPIPPITAKNLKPPENLPQANERVQSVGRWRWSPLTCFEEFCANISTEKFANLSISLFPDPIRGCRRVLAELYKETAGNQHNASRIHEDINSSAIVATEEVTRTKRKLLVLNKARDKLAAHLEAQKFNMNATDKSTKIDNGFTVPASAEVATDVYDQLVQKATKNREALESRKEEQIPTFIDTARVEETIKVPRHFEENLVVDYCPTGSSAPALWPSCEPQNLAYAAKRVELPGLSASGPIFPFTVDLNIHKFWEDDKRSKLKTTHSLWWALNTADCSPYQPTDSSKSYASYFPYKYEDAMKRSEVLNDGVAPKTLKNEQFFEPVHPEKPVYHKRNKSSAHKSGQIHHRSYQTGEVKHRHGYKVHANDVNEAVISDFRVLSFNDDQFKQAGKLAKDPRSRRSRQISQPTKYFAVKNESGLSFSPQRVPIYYHRSRDEEKSHFADGKKPYYQPIRIIRPDETGAEKN